MYFYCSVSQPINVNYFLKNTNTHTNSLPWPLCKKELRAYPVALKRATGPPSQAQEIPVPGISVIQKLKVATFHGRRLLNLEVARLKVAFEGLLGNSSRRVQKAAQRGNSNCLLEFLVWAGSPNPGIVGVLPFTLRGPLSR